MTFGYTEEEVDKRIHEPCNVSYRFLAAHLNKTQAIFELHDDFLPPTKEESIKLFYKVLLEESRKRGLEYKEKFHSKELIATEEFEQWQRRMRNNPTYIREIYSTNLLGDYDISYAEDEIIGFDYPVRRPCVLLNEKGYDTYWSSANYDDYKYRYSQVIENKNVAYILIDAQNLSKKLKKELYLTGDCDFWGIAPSHADKGRYYGVYAEILSVNTKCDHIREELLEKVEKLPILVKKNKKI